ncbi:MAG TPA: sulfatase-like hydrolase/transferase [Gaiellaceae bacterium]|nr:sulfatase-like hydrolase/transferase [Gaiellaceae bacterium]
MRLGAPRLRIAGLHLLVLWSFAVAEPVFDLLGQNGEFFAARGSSGTDVILFALLLAFGPPALLLGLEALTPRRARAGLHALLVAALVGLLTLEAIRSWGASGWLLVAIAGAIGVGAAVLYFRLEAARLLLTVLAPVPLLFVVLFLFHSDASQLTLTGTGTASAANERPDAPLVMVVFDELPVNSLLDRHGLVDSVRYPHFAALQRSSTWFANESVVSEGTLHGVPSLLTGRFPRPSELPVYHDHPHNLFTLFGRQAEMHVFETETHLCPPKLCHESSGSFGGQLGSLFADTSVVYLHQLLPTDLTTGIPSVSNGWQDFWRNGGGANDPARRFARFLPTIRPTRRPTLWYLHFLLPHSPWRFLPSGERYSIRPAPGWSAAEVWNDNQAAVDQYWQRHLLQLGYADRLLGHLIARLRSTGLYDRSLLVVTADEGLSFRAGEKRRPASAANLQDISYVPLFMKLPGERRGRIVRRATRSADVLPTIAAALGVTMPWPVEGQNLLHPTHVELQVSVAKDHGRRLVVPAPELAKRREAALRRQVSIFGSDERPSALFAIGPDRRLLGHPFKGGRPVGDLDPIDRSGALIQVSGRVTGPARSVVVVADGRTVAVDPVVQGRFWALVPRDTVGAAPLRVFSIP